MVTNRHIAILPAGQLFLAPGDTKIIFQCYSKWKGEKTFEQTIIFSLFLTTLKVNFCLLQENGTVIKEINLYYGDQNLYTVEKCSSASKKARKMILIIHGIRENVGNSDRKNGILTVNGAYIRANNIFFYFITIQSRKSPDMSGR